MRLIDADRLQKDINDYPYGYRGMINDTIARQPTVEPKHGHNTGEGVRWFKCSVCGWGFNDIFMTDESNIDTFPNYCPNCGAQMDEIEEHLVMPKADGSTIPKDYMTRVKSERV